ncbi:hypothetical protein C8J57DRAFT_716940 [Mycena rebaudengoi]|nr:hypothetical protein C8J57DRAFT_716940 [Mycena rebaudengoi]
MVDGTGTAPVRRVPWNRRNGHGRQPYALASRVSYVARQSYFRALPAHPLLEARLIWALYPSALSPSRPFNSLCTLYCILTRTRGFRPTSHLHDSARISEGCATGCLGLLEGGIRGVGQGGRAGHTLLVRNDSDGIHQIFICGVAAVDRDCVILAAFCSILCDLGGSCGRNAETYEAFDALRGIAVILELEQVRRIGRRFGQRG